MWILEHKKPMLLVKLCTKYAKMFAQVLLEPIQHEVRASSACAPYVASKAACHTVRFFK
jgi:hypothetical protein